MDTMISKAGTALTSFVILLLPLTAIAQEDDLNVELDANIGIENMEEPDASNKLENNTYLALSVAALLQAWNLQAYIQAPLRFNFDGFSIREADWDETEEILRAFRCVRLDYMSSGGYETRLSETGECLSWTPDEAVGDVATTREEFLYLSARMRPVNAYSLGYGSLVQGYTAMLEEDHYREGVSLEANINRHFVINAALSDIVDPTATMGRVAFRPIQSSAVGEVPGYGEETADTDLFVEVGVTAASDLSVPTNLNVATGATESGDPFLAGGVDARIRYSVEDTWTTEDYRVLRFEYGAEFNKLFDYGQAMHNHLRFYYDVGAVDFYLDGEYRLLLGQYIPAYFDQHYRVQRSQYLLSEEQRAEVGSGQLSMTKVDFLGTLPDKNEHAYAATARFRFWSEDESGDGWSRAFDFWLFAEQVPGRDLSGRAGAGFTVYDLMDKINISGQFVQQGWDDLGGLFTLANSVLEVDARWLLVDNLYIDFFFDQTWFLVGDSGFDTANDVGVGLGYLPEF